MHIERYENLKPYSFIDHGCMDGTYTTDLEAFNSYQVRLWDCVGHGFSHSPLHL